MDPFNPSTIRHDHFTPASEPIYLPAPGSSAYLGGNGEMQADQQPEAEALVAAVAALDDVAAIATDTLVVEQPAAAPIYPRGNVVDFNKPFLISDINNEDDVHTDAKILAVLGGNDFPVVIMSIDSDGDEFVHQFNTDGEEMNNDLEVKNVVPEVFPRTIYILIEKERRDLTIDSNTYNTEADAVGAATDPLFAVFPITIDADTFAIRQPVIIDNDTGQDVGFQSAESDGNDDVFETESEAEIEEEGDDTAEQLPEGAVYVNGIIRKPGDKLNTNRAGRGYRRCTVIKTRSDPFKSLYVQADSGSEEPYWARNKSVQNY